MVISKEWTVILHFPSGRSFQRPLKKHPASGNAWKRESTQAFLMQF